MQYERDVTTGRLAGSVPQLEVAITQLEGSLLRKKNWHKAPLPSLDPAPPRSHEEFYQYAVGEQARFFVTDPRSWRRRRWNDFVAEFRTNHRVSVVTPPDYIADP
ncbi:MAG: hypothetical protein Q8O40_03550 [Chloroflexota bacterium]|nr:hypothetical protein [Chloroflexota bacterium]